ncbi:MAG: hypothetical protein ACQESN_11105 [Thermotogota bacterium]
MKTIIIVITLVIGTATISCEKDTTTICENLLEQGSADTTLLKGEWDFEFFAYTPNGNKIKNNKEIMDSWMYIEDICNQNSNDTCYMYVYSDNSIRYIYTLENNNGISFNMHGSTYVNPSEEEVKITNALSSAFCYVIKDNELLFHYEEDDYENNILILKRK